MLLVANKWQQIGSRGTRKNEELYFLAGVCESQIPVGEYVRYAVFVEAYSMVRAVFYSTVETCYLGNLCGVTVIDEIISMSGN